VGFSCKQTLYIPHAPDLARYRSSSKRPKAQRGDLGNSIFTGLAVRQPINYEKLNLYQCHRRPAISTAKKSIFINTPQREPTGPGKLILYQCRRPADLLQRTLSVSVPLDAGDWPRNSIFTNVAHRRPTDSKKLHLYQCRPSPADLLQKTPSLSMPLDPRRPTSENSIFTNVTDPPTDQLPKTRSLPVSPSASRSTPNKLHLYRSRQRLKLVIFKNSL
jgi:hypothetical protein